jgi:hypothetical protein
MAGKQVKLFLVEGTPGGLTTAEITNWTGHIVTGPRSRLAELLDRDEAKRTGVYLLLGDDPEAPAGVRCYIGEADEVRTRLKEHHSGRGKEFWDRVVVITSKDANLTKSHCRYLEAKLIALADAAGRSLLDNNTKPPPPMLPEADVSDMDYFIDQLKIVLPVLGVNVPARPQHHSRHPRGHSHRSRRTVTGVPPDRSQAQHPRARHAGRWGVHRARGVDRRQRSPHRDLRAQHRRRLQRVPRPAPQARG